MNAGIPSRISNDSNSKVTLPISIHTAILLYPEILVTVDTVNNKPYARKRVGKSAFRKVPEAFSSKQLHRLVMTEGDGMEEPKEP